jgi:Rps23 Pro-64 3,4-dihydroxylase Tpa1-like proline 4-hydroxylase
MQYLAQVRYDPVFHIIIDNVFGTTMNSEIFRHILSLKNHYRKAGVSNRHIVFPTYRTNLVCFIESLYRISATKTNEANQLALTEQELRLKSPLLRAIEKFLSTDYIKNLMESGPSPLCEFYNLKRREIQVSRYGEDQFYTWHKDDQGNKTRQITLVYYVHAIPKRFSGGELFLSDGTVHKGKLSSGSKSTCIEPENDRLVIFASKISHRVNLTASSGHFEDGRFSVNIWIGESP